ncbi:MAG: hypothetical protein KI786_13180 [Mameliella sp.]|nr:hypothetical protein [Phaeodactylibacter sp.]
MNKPLRSVSAADFANKVGIALKDMLESHYWIKITIVTLEQHTIWLPLEKETNELKRVLGCIHSKSSKRR